MDKSAAVLDYLQRKHTHHLRGGEGGRIGRCTGESGETETWSALLGDIRWVRRLTERPALYPRGVMWYSSLMETHGPLSGDTLIKEAAEASAVMARQTESEASVQYNVAAPYNRTGSFLFERPSALTSRRHANLIGSVMPVVAAEVSLSVEALFGWDQTPTLEQIVKHLAHIVASYDPQEKVACPAKTSSDFLFISFLFSSHICYCKVIKCKLNIKFKKTCMLCPQKQVDHQQQSCVKAK